MKALHLCEDILTTVGISSPELLEIILDGTFSDILRHVARVTLTSPLEDISPSLSVAKRRRTDAHPEGLAKKEREVSESLTAEGTHGETKIVKVIRRTNEMIEMNIRNPETTKSFQAGAPTALGVSLIWSSDTGRCVDASPVLLVQEGTNQRSDVFKTTVFIGSHSHRVQALDLDTGSLLWERVLGDRIEASAAVSHCGTLLVIGQCQHSEYFVIILHCRFLCLQIIFVFSQVATMAVCIFCALPLERHGGCLRQEML